MPKFKIGELALSVEDLIGPDGEVLLVAPFEVRILSLPGSAPPEYVERFKDIEFMYQVEVLRWYQACGKVWSREANLRKLQDDPWGVIEAWTRWRPPTPYPAKPAKKANRASHTDATTATPASSGRDRGLTE